MGSGPRCVDDEGGRRSMCGGGAWGGGEVIAMDRLESGPGSGCDGWFLEMVVLLAEKGKGAAAVVGGFAKLVFPPNAIFAFLPLANISILIPFLLLALRLLCFFHIIDFGPEAKVPEFPEREPDADDDFPRLVLVADIGLFAPFVGALLAHTAITPLGLGPSRIWVAPGAILARIPLSRK